MPETIRVALQVVGWCFAGLFIMAWAFHITDVGWSRILLSLGMLVGYGGMIVTLVLAYRRAEERGDL